MQAQAALEYGRLSPGGSLSCGSVTVSSVSAVQDGAPAISVLVPAASRPSMCVVPGGLRLPLGRLTCCRQRLAVFMFEDERRDSGMMFKVRGGSPTEKELSCRAAISMIGALCAPPQECLACWCAQERCSPVPAALPVSHAAPACVRMQGKVESRNDAAGLFKLCFEDGDEVEVRLAAARALGPCLACVVPTRLVLLPVLWRPLRRPACSPP